MCHLTLSLLLLLLLLSATASATTTASATPPPPRPNITTRIGLTYTPLPNTPPPERVATSLSKLHVSTLRLLDPSPSLIRFFSTTNFSLLLTVPNHLIPPFSANLSAATLWLAAHVIPFYPRAKISKISVGDDVISASSVSAFPRSFDPSVTLLPAIQNLHLALHNYGISTISVSTSFSFTEIMTTSFPPSRAEFRDPIGELVIKPLLTFLEETNSYFMVNVYPYNVFKGNSEIPIGYALFEEHEFNFRDDTITGLRYRNLYDMMVDSVIAAMASMGYENIPIIVTETGWPIASASASAASGGGGEAEESSGFVEMYLSGLVKHLRSGEGTPLRKEGAVEAYIYELFDGDSGNRTLQQDDWGIMYNNMSLKYKIDLLGAGDRIGGKWFCSLTAILVVLIGLEIVW